ncbi:hypothetical protein VHEMI01566 [[Torrubiella] hemipterigena]|uniref:Sas10/Utp3/C1D-like protein n=1 Tax=[Torrubiella] hemipterigena TaxID=1531966 RepID=A0A0A1T7V1_9HYPO|nr:hypothetical protein VHEMI01566 [[Torrubiella] hemipterigena]
MAAPATLPALLTSLTQSLTLAQEATPTIAAIEHQQDGISLLDVKNELLLSYLQNLVFLILVKLRNAKDSKKEPSDIDESVRTQLVELRLYLEKGARPLEEKLRFSIERFLRSADDALREEKQRQEQLEKGSDDDEEDEDEDDEDDSEEDEEVKPSKPLHQKHGKNAAAPRFGTLVDDVTAKPAQRQDGPGGVYKAPKRERQLMETQRKDKMERRPNRSRTMEEFVNSELSSAPMAEPSIGTTIVQGGRRMKTTDERKDEAERRDYEEANFVRLPSMSKKEKAKKAKQSGRPAMQFGGEEWHDLGQGIDRIDRLTKGKGGGKGSGVRAMLDKSRKRGRETTDGPRASGHVDMGDRFRKKVKMLDAGRRDRGKGRS